MKRSIKAVSITPAPSLPPPPPPPTSPATPNYATLVERFAAVLIDGIIATLAGLIPLVLIALFSFFAPYELFLPAILFFFATYFLYFSYFEGRSGQTIGKRALRIKVVDEQTFKTVDMGRAMIRNVLRIIDMLPFFYIIGLALISTSSKKQRLGDHAARTVVLKL